MDKIEDVELEKAYQLQDKVEELTKFKYEVELRDEVYISQPVLRNDTCCYN